jgi:hypothetical protein
MTSASHVAESLLYPVFAQVGLTFVLLLATGASRTAAVKRREVHMKDVSLGQTEVWPARPQQIARAFQNQLETPVLFYAVTAFTLLMQCARAETVILSWIYVASRLVHAFIHTRSNHVPHRFRAFIAGVVVLITLWILLAIQVVSRAG